MCLVIARCGFGWLVALRRTDDRFFFTVVYRWSLVALFSKRTVVILLLQKLEESVALLTAAQ